MKRIFAAIGLCSLVVSASGQIDLGAAGEYAVVSTGEKLRLNSGPNIGDFLVGQGVQASFSGGGDGQILGTLFFDSTVTGTSTFDQLEVAPTTLLVSTDLTLQAHDDANAASLFAESLSPTQTLGALSGDVTINGNGGLNVINIEGLHNATVMINGTANDIFVFNVAGDFSTNRRFILNGGVGASNLLFNLLATDGNIFQTSGGNELYGTFLATRGGDFNFSNLNLTGALINTAGEVGIVSGSSVSFAGFDGEECIADIDNDGDVDHIDILEFLEWFISGDPAADLNGDGALDYLDVKVLILALIDGC